MSATARADLLAGEEPLGIRVDGTALTMTMRTPGDDIELAAGFLVGEAVVATADHGLLGQCGPGTEVRFRPVGIAEAVDAWRSARRRLEHTVVGHYPLAVD